LPFNKTKALKYYGIRTKVESSEEMRRNRWTAFDRARVEFMTADRQAVCCGAN
jgi:hypothetical protein